MTRKRFDNSRGKLPKGDDESLVDARPSRKRRVLLVVAGATAAIIVAGLAFAFSRSVLGPGLYAQDRRPTTAMFVGSEACAQCHRGETALWHYSQHKLAMAHASERSVLADFRDTSFDYFGVHSRFYRRDGKYFVATDGPDGELAEFEIKYTFGIDPLQQYLVEFPGGRIQALSIAWDNRPKDEGGQHWFHLYPSENISHDDVLHWTKLNQNWNFMCAECHSTGVQKNYNAFKDQFATTWAEISVGCEACHGQGSNHVAWARRQQSWWPFGKTEDRSKGLLVRFDERTNVIWRQDRKADTPQRSWPPPLLRKEVETCGLCHARRGQFAEKWVPGQWLSDTHAVTPLTPEFYFADGQMRNDEETYNYGPFKQSKMFAAGVTCGDCHDPHSAKLRTNGENVCMQCHSPEKYAAARHSHHEGTKQPVTCSSCHMPSRTYMVIDRRHDHSFRVPRPDLSAKLGTPNACNDCHRDKSADWASAVVTKWFGADRHSFQTYPEAFHAAWAGEPNAGDLLAAAANDANVPGYARGSALTELASYLSATNIDVAKRGLSDADPMVRIGALDMLAGVPPSQLWQLAAPLLSDSIRGVRIKAVDLLAGVPRSDQPGVDREAFERAASEFVAAQRLNADRPEARSALGDFYARRSQSADAEAEYRAALRLSPQYAPAVINLADLYRQLNRDIEGEAVLRAALAISPADAGLHYAMGLTLTRLKRADQALAEFRRAFELRPQDARYGYVFAVALHSAGHVDDAMGVLRENLVRHPNDRDTLIALIGFNRDAGDFADALRYAEQLATITPNDFDLADLIVDLRRRVK